MPHHNHACAQTPVLSANKRQASMPGHTIRDNSGVAASRRLSGVIMKALSLLAIMSFAISVASADIYRWTDSNGNVHFADQAPEDQTSESLDLQINTYESVTYDSLTFELPATPAGKRVVMYSATWCGVCDKAKRYFEQKKIPYTEYDVETSQQGKQGFEQLGGTGVPIILVGKRRMNGFSVAGFENLYR